MTMKTAIVHVSEIATSGTLCLSPLRYVGECHKCYIFKRALERYHGDVDKAIASLRCNPRVNERWIELYKEKRKHLDAIREIEKEMGVL